MLNRFAKRLILVTLAVQITDIAPLVIRVRFTSFCRCNTSGFGEPIKLVIIKPEKITLKHCIKQTNKKI